MSMFFGGLWMLSVSAMLLIISLVLIRVAKDVASIKHWLGVDEGSQL